MKYVFLTICLAAALFQVSGIQAQSLTGIWYRSGTKLFITDKATGKQTAASAETQEQFDKSAAARGYKETLELKSDNTYISTVGTADDKNPTAHQGKYSYTGNTLEMNIPLVNNEKTTITVKTLTNTTMIWDLVFMNRLTEIIYSRTP